MNKKRNVNFIKPEDPAFLKVLKKQAGYDDKNHKFDDLRNAEEDFAVDDDSEQPQVVVLREGDLTAEEADVEQKRIEKEEAETKADLNQKIIFKAKVKPDSDLVCANRKRPIDTKEKASKDKKSRQLLSFDSDEENEDSD